MDQLLLAPGDETVLVMLHIAGADHFVTPDKQQLIHEGSTTIPG